MIVMPQDCWFGARVLSAASRWVGKGAERDEGIAVSSPQKASLVKQAPMVCRWLRPGASNQCVIDQFSWGGLAMDATELTTIEKDFLRSQGLTHEDVYDGRFEVSAVWKANAKEAGLNIILGTPCQKAGHRLRTRAGHCVQCDTKKIAYQHRHSVAGYIYIAGSKRAQLLKVGTAVDIGQRERNLQNQRYAGMDDWIILFSARVGSGGRIEGEVLKRLAQFRANRSYEKDGQQQDAVELVSASLSRVMKVVRNILEQEGASEYWCISGWRDYEFRQNRGAPGMKGR